MTPERKALIKKYLVGEISWRRFVLSFLFIYVSIWMFGCMYANKLIFQPHPSSYKTLTGEVSLKSGDREIPITAVFLEDKAATFTVLYSHGNAEDLGDCLPMLRLIHKQGYSVMGYDYRGYGTSEGSPSESGAYDDILACWEYLVEERGVPPERIIIWGRSLGGGPSCWLAARKPCGGLVAESTFLTAFRVVTVYPLFPIDKFRNSRRIGKIDCPMLSFHGRPDKVVPFWHGEKLYEMANEPKMKLWLDEAGHNDFLYHAGDQFFETFNEFAALVESENRQRAKSKE